MNEILCAIVNDNKNFPISVVFRENLFEEFLKKFPEALKIFLYDEEIEMLKKYKYNEFCCFIKSKLENILDNK